jgi:hypothetical protein
MSDQGDHALSRAAHAQARMVAVVHGLCSAVLRSALLPTVGLALWHRAARASLHRSIAALLELPPFRHAIQDNPNDAVRELLRNLPFAARALAGDIGLLARLFARLTGEHEVRLRLEHVGDDACRRYHVDAVRLRLLCTYAGRGTEWLEKTERTRSMPAMQVGVFKGSRFPDAAPRVLHRSPPVSHLQRQHRSRLLLCIDQPGVF